MQKNVIYIKGVGYLWMDVAETLYKSYGWKPVLWVAPLTASVTKARLRFKETLFYDQGYARRGLPPTNLPGLNLPAIDAEVLEGLSMHEPVIYEMMSRWFLLGKYDFDWASRRHFYHNLLRIWIAIIRELNVDVIVCGNIPHRTFDYVVYLICQQMGISYLMIEMTNLDHLQYAISSITDRSRAIREEFDKISSDFSLSPPTEEYIRRLRERYDDAMPSYFKEKVIAAQNRDTMRKLYDRMPGFLQAMIKISINAVKGRLSEKTGMLHFKRSTRNNSDTPDYANYLQMLLAQSKVNNTVKKAERWYKKNAVKPDFSKPYIYFAAHFQPERSTCPDAGVYHDHALKIDVLSKSLPAGWEIYYKEHPSNFRRPYKLDNIRDTRFYERIKRIPNCILIDYKTDQFKLIDNAKATATARGTAGWEGVLRGVAAIIFGDYWYSSCPGIFKVRTFEDCKDAIEEIQKGYKPDQREVRRYLAATELICEDLQFRREQESLFQIKQKNFSEYDKKVQLLAKVLADEYFRVHDHKS